MWRYDELCTAKSEQLLYYTNTLTNTFIFNFHVTVGNWRNALSPQHNGIGSREHVVGKKVVCYAEPTVKATIKL